MAESAPPVAVVRRTFSVAPEKVFDALLDAEVIGRWMFGPDDQIIHIEVEPHVGDRFSFFIKRDEMEIDHEGEYLEIDRPRRLRFTWAATVADEEADASEVDIDLQPAAAGCELTLSHHLHPGWADFLSQAEQSWGAMLDRLRDVL